MTENNKKHLDKHIRKAALVMGRSLDSLGSVRVQQEGGAEPSELGWSSPSFHPDWKGKQPQRTAPVTVLQDRELHPSSH